MARLDQPSFWVDPHVLRYGARSVPTPCGSHTECAATSQRRITRLPPPHLQPLSQLPKHVLVVRMVGQIVQFVGVRLHRVLLHG